MDVHIAKECAYYSNLAYKGFSETLRHEINRHLPHVIFFNSRKSQAFLAWDDELAVIMFRGVKPSGKLNLLSYLKTWLTFSNDPHGLVHKNFYTALNHIWDQIEAVLDRVVEKHGIKRVIFTGHSQGGAMAILAAARSKYVCEVYTFGAPRVGNRRYGLGVKSKVYRIVNGNDLVPRVPPAFPVFRHFGTKYHILNGKVYQPQGSCQEFWYSMHALMRRDFISSLITDHKNDAYRRNVELLDQIA